MSIIIDGFSHMMPKAFLEALSLAYPTDELRELAGHTYFGETETRVRILDKHKIDKQVLTLARPTIWINMPPDVTLRMTRVANDTLASLAKSFPDRFIPVGTLPILTEEFMPEFDR